MMSAYILVSDVGLNGYVIHGAFAPEPPSDRTVGMAKAFCEKWTGYVSTDVVELELNGDLPCGGRCTRVVGGAWADCYCYANRCNDTVVRRFGLEGRDA